LFSRAIYQVASTFFEDEDDYASAEAAAKSPVRATRCNKVFVLQKVGRKRDHPKVTK
jgi:hypothetical protein